MKLRWGAALGALACAVAVAGCGDIPVLPQWDADWFLPLPSQKIDFGSQFGGATLPANSSFGFNYSVTQDMNGAIGDVLKKDLKGASVILTLQKHTQLATNDTLFVGESSGSLTAGNARTIKFVLNMLVADTSVTDTTTITPQNVQMLSDVANAKGNLFIKMSGRASTGAQPVTFSAADTMNIRSSLIATIAVSR